MKREQIIETSFSTAAEKFREEHNLSNLAYLCLYGSQNYDLDTTQSDIDIKGFVYPTIEDIALMRNPISGAGLYKNEKGKGTVSIEDMRSFASRLKKSNFNALEFLYSPYFSFEGTTFSKANVAIRELKAYRNDITEISPEGLYNSARGVAQTAMKRISLKSYENWGKAVAQILRVTNFCQEYSSTKDFWLSLKAFPIYSRDMIIAVKMRKIPRELCEGVAGEAMKKISDIGSFGIKAREENRELIDEIVCMMIKGGLK